ncbi:glutathione S-transferase family protein [Trichocoleus sp. FACHB-591]|uniref:glutathione S-transferase family protein n=1 Tax=Trichocoleus sp. FACHB-591 TaxID=2692872 RepID=UPI001687388F|nr:glutathione S-transferase family protein [Trichocoleus sp. FACHB-591]MBD2098529.1 glutathione S-transferase family protein [Trichocoleus sp. FACHB-591]
MLKFYYAPLSPNARRVWLTLLEKQIPFEPVLMQLNGDQFQPEFAAINPFHHIPVVLDEGVRVLESLAILDYLEAKYPQPALLPTEPQAIATVRMAQMVMTNELGPAVFGLVVQPEEPKQLERIQLQVAQGLSFLNELLGDRPYFGSDQLTLGDVVAGVVVSLLPYVQVDLVSYPALKAWSERLMAREAWQKTQPNPQQFEEFRRRVKIIAKQRLRHYLQGRRRDKAIAPGS